jgi:hypothetical protein
MSSAQVANGFLMMDLSSPRGTSRREDCESPAIVTRGYRQVPFEGYAHPLLVTEAATTRDFIDVKFGFFQQAARSFDAKKLKSLGRSSSGLGLVPSSEVSRAHIYVRCEHLHSQLRVLQVFRNPLMKFIEDRRVGGL